MSQELTVRLEHHHGLPIVTVTGDLDVFSARQMYVQGQELADEALGAAPSRAAVSRELEQAHAGRPRGAADKSQDSATRGGDRPPTDRRVLILDLSGVPFADSAGVGAIVGVLRRAHAQGADLTLAGVNPHLAHLLHIMGLTKVLTLHATVLDAIQATSSDGDDATSTTADAERSG